MTGKTISQPGAPLAIQDWASIDWATVRESVRRLQMRIAKATREGKANKAKALQWILTHSYYAKLLAIKRVTEAVGSKTPGVDGEIWKYSNKKKRDAVNRLRRRGYQPRPLRRIYIPKKKGKQRPLSIPCMIDRAQQALHLLGLEPISETLADKNAYGFRPKRSVADAIEQCFKTLGRKNAARWILEGDIKACFDKIGKDWLINNIPMDKTILKKWLTAGYIDKGVFYHTQEGVPQGGIISPTLMVITLSGLERAVKLAAPKRSDKVHMIGYADDFVITGASAEILEYKIKPAVERFLNARNLELSKEKTKIVQIQDGFDFLGFNIRKYKDKLLTKPAKQNVLEFVSKIREVIKNNKATSAGRLISHLNPKLTGWGNFYQHAVAKRAYSYVDHQIFNAIYAWAKRRHKNKGKRWIINKYYDTNAGSWVFKGVVKTEKGKTKTVYLKALSTIPIKRHTKVRADATPYDPIYDSYYQKRKESQKGRNTWNALAVTAL